MESSGHKSRSEVPDDVRSMLREGKLESALSELRARGFPIIFAIRAVRDVMGQSLANSKELVHMSDAWKDMRPEMDALHAELSEAVEKLLEMNEDEQQALLEMDRNDPPGGLAEKPGLQMGELRDQQVADGKPRSH